MRILKSFTLAVLAFLATSIQAQENNYNPSVIEHQIQGLKMFGSVLYIAAHPDDENTRLISWLTKEKHYRTAYLSLTRGDGGQNLIGDEQGIELGMIRTQELLAARRIDGAEQFFSRAYDFGYSKNPEETFEKWNKAEIMKDMVTVIRYFKPDVIITRFPTTGEGGHGHHTASAILAVEAFDLAADSSYHDHNNQQPWKTTRLLWNTFNFGGTNLTDSTQFKVDVGGYNKLLGKSYGEIAAVSRSQHRSQGFGSAPNRTTQYEYFKTLKGSAPVNDLMDGVNTSILRYEGAGSLSRAVLKSIAGKIDSLQLALDENKKIGLLLDIVELTERPRGRSMVWFPLPYPLNEHAKEILWRISGTFAEVYSKQQIVSSRESKVFLAVNKRRKDVSLNTDASGSSVHFGNSKYEEVRLKNIESIDTSLSPFGSNENIIFSQPYSFSRISDGNRFKTFDISPIFLNAGLGGIVSVTFNSIGRTFAYEISDLPLNFKKTDPSKGEIFDNVCYTYPVSVGVGNENIIVPKSKMARFEFLVKNYSRDTLKNAMLFLRTEDPSLSIKQGNLTSTIIPFLFPGEQKVVSAEFDATNFSKSFSAFPILGTNDGKEYSMQMRELRYEHIPTQFYHVVDSVKVIVMDLKTTAKRIGYIPGAGDKVADCLKEIGYDVTILDNDKLATEDLGKYQAIVMGVRAYNTNEKLVSVYPKLMDYVKNGGRIISQYNTNNRIGPVVAPMGPYPFTISRNRVTDENAEVKFTNPTSSFLNKPYKISSEDFQGWIQERGIYFVTDRDSNYRTLFTMKDPGEKESDGSLIWCDYGKGKFIYTGLVFFRELPAGVTGAYKLIINLIEAP